MDVATERLLRDCFPCEVLLDGRVVKDCRVFVTSERLLVWHEVAHRPVVLLNEPRASTTQVERDRGTLRDSLAVQVADGRIVFVNQGRGCGCHSVLKALGPPVPW